MLREEGVTNFDKYVVNPKYKDELFLDFYVEPTPGSKFIYMPMGAKL